MSSRRAFLELSPGFASRVSRRIAAAALAIALAAPSLSWAEPRSPWAEGGIGVACVLTSLFYSTAKLFYAGAGTLTGLAGFALTGGRRDVLDTIINPALRGDYVITPEHLEGKRRLVFIGPYAEDVAEQSESEPGGDTGQRETEPYPF